MSLDRQKEDRIKKIMEDLALNSPVFTDKDGLRLFMSIKSF